MRDLRWTDEQRTSADRPRSRRHDPPHTRDLAGCIVATIESAAFFSLDEKHWPNFATVVWTDEHDEARHRSLPPRSTG